MPFWDQWDGELERLYEPYLNGTLSLKDFFLPANEHRIVMMRILNLLVFILNGEKVNCILTMSIQSIIPALTSFFLFKKINHPKIQILSSLIIGGLFAFPFAWENFFWAYQGQVFFLILFSVLAFEQIAKINMNMGYIILFSFLAGINMASAFLITFIAGVITILHFIFVKREKKLLLTALIFFIVMYLLTLMIWRSAAADTLVAKSIEQFFKILDIYISWPNKFGYFFWILLSIFSIKTILKFKESTENQRFGMILFIWVVLISCSASYVRAMGGSVGNRYFDYMVFLFIAFIFMVDSFLKERRNIKWNILLKLISIAVIINLGMESYIGAQQRMGAFATFKIDLIEAMQNEQIKEGRAIIYLSDKPIIGYPSNEFIGHLLERPTFQYMLRGYLEE